MEKKAEGRSRMAAFRQRCRIWQCRELRQALLALAVILAVGLAVDTFCQRGVVGLPSEEKGTFDLELDTVSAEGFLRTEQGLLRVGEEAALEVELGGRYVSRFCLSYDCGDRTILTWYVWQTGEDKPRVFQDRNNILIHTTVERLDMPVDRIRIEWGPDDGEKDVAEGDSEEKDGAGGRTGQETVVTGLYLVNRWEVNGHRVFFVCVVAGLAFFLWLSRLWAARRPDIVYLAAALSLGTLIIVMIPANKVSWDEEVHFYHTYCVSHFGAEVKTNPILEQLFVASRENWPYDLPANREERAQMNEELNRRVEEEEYSYSHGHALAGIYTPAYIPQALGLRIGLLLRLPFTAAYQMGRLFNLLFCALVMAGAIRRIPCGKAILAMIGLLPTPLFLMSVYSYDAFITSLFALGFACFLAEYSDRSRPVSRTYFAVIAACFALGSAPKAIYAPMILVFWLMPREKFTGKRQELLMKGIVAALFLALMASFVLPTLLSPAQTNDLRGGDTSEARQIPYILSDIPRFLRLLLSSIRSSIPHFLVGSAVYGRLAHLRAEMLETVLPLFVLAVIFADEKRLPGQRPLDLAARAWTLLLCFGVIVMIWAAMYLAFTPVGADVINGVQERYYIPLLLFIYLCACPGRLKLSVRGDTSYPLVIAGASALTAVAVAQTMLVLCG